jgi:hypothetical protein
MQALPPPDEDEEPVLFLPTLSSAVSAKLRVLDVSDCWNLSNINIVRNCVQLRCLWMPGCSVQSVFSVPARSMRRDARGAVDGVLSRREPGPPKGLHQAPQA